MLCAASVFVSGCFGDACTAVEVPSVRVLLTGDNSSPAVDRVTYEVDGMEEPCMSTGPNTLACGFEAEGELVIRAYPADGSDPIEQRVTVTAGSCHVTTEEISLDVAT